MPPPNHERKPQGNQYPGQVEKGGHVCKSHKMLSLKSKLSMANFTQTGEAIQRKQIIRYWTFSRLVHIEGLPGRRGARGTVLTIKVVLLIR